MEVETESDYCNRCRLVFVENDCNNRRPRVLFIKNELGDGARFDLYFPRVLFVKNELGDGTGFDLFFVCSFLYIMN